MGRKEVDEIGKPFHTTGFSAVSKLKMWVEEIVEKKSIEQY